ncbi:MAG TPA: BTAD domain-containing putative transcriptional regulator [Streptosporangiaceae bacterium]|nr:BTAD domain-containing putative transcriptional regulator [Streptosporangiaceae bacterium]
MMRFRILGPLEVQTGGAWTSIGAAKWRAVLARLLLSAGQIVSTDTLIDELWGDEPPARATNLVSIYVLRLRRLIGDTDGKIIVTRAPGYQLRLAADDLDAQQFGLLLGQGRQALTNGDPQQAAKLLTDALSLWRGKALADVSQSAFIEAEAERLDELRLSATELRIEADLACGRHRDVIPELHRLLADQQLKEELWLLLMRALDGAGRRAEALTAYEQARTVIADQLGVDPGPEIQQLFQELLAEDAQQSPAAKQASAARKRKARPDAGEFTTTGQKDTEYSPAEGTAAGESRGEQVGAASPDSSGPPGSIALGTVDTGAAPGEEAAAPAPPEPGPMQLPADIADFTGREMHVRQLCSLLSVVGRGDDSPGAVPVALVAGAGGLGKTTLAIHAAHRIRADYPGGQLYVDLLGASPQPLAPADVLARFLRDLGVKGEQIPVSEDERAALFRTRLNGRRVLLLLDNARDAAQVRPLLPGTASCAVIVTSRSRLSDLVGGGLVHLDVLDDAEALALFSRIVGTQRAAAEPDATAELLVACAGLPLAIRISAARLAARSNWTIRSLANRIGDEHRRLDELKVGDLAVRASFEVSFASLPASVTRGGVAPARAFRMLGLWQGPSIALDAAAALLGEPEGKVADVLEFLVDAHLLESSAPDCYSFHDLLRVYAAERAAAEEPDEARQDAVRRIVAWYLHTASAADSIVSPQRDRPDLDPVPPGCHPLTFTTLGGALEWCQQERGNIVAAARLAAGAGLHAIAWKLPVAVLSCFNRLSFRTEWLDSQLIALNSVRIAGDRPAEAWVLNNLGLVCIQQRTDDAVGYFEAALAIRRECGDLRGEAISRNNLADAYLRLGRTAEALDQFERTLSVLREAGNRYGEGAVLTGMGQAHLNLGHADEAIGYLQQGREIFVDINTPHGEDVAVHHLARAYLELGRTQDAIRSFHDALTISRAVGDRDSQALTLMFLGRAQRRAGNLEQARESWAGAQALFEELGDEEQLAVISSYIADIDAISA